MGKVSLSSTVFQKAEQFNLHAAAMVVDSATNGAVSSSDFLFFAAFDGTGNTINNDPRSNNQTTNVVNVQTPV